MTTREDSSEVRSQFERSVDEGDERLSRTWPGLLATGLVGGLDVGIGVFALLLVLHETGSLLLSGLALGVGFIALTLGQSELFTENYLVPIAAVAAARQAPRKVGRLWLGTAAMNLIGGWVITWVIMVSAPHLTPTTIDAAMHYVELGISWPAFALAVLAGIVMTLMTWMERSSEVLAKVAAAMVAAFLLGAGELNHVIVVSLEMFAALHAGAPFGYATWAGAAALSAVGNTIGGVAFVTITRLVQVGRLGVQGGPAPDDDHGEDRPGADRRRGDRVPRA